MKILTAPEREEIAQRIAQRRAHSTKQLMADYGCSRSVIDQIARKSKMLDVPRETTASKKCVLEDDPEIAQLIASAQSS